jgi:hypothetical protein
MIEFSVRNARSAVTGTRPAIRSLLLQPASIIEGFRQFEPHEVWSQRREKEKRGRFGPSSIDHAEKHRGDHLTEISVGFEISVRLFDRNPKGH